MKILFLHDKFNENGGAERYIITKRKELEQEGHETFLFSTTEDKELRIKNSKILKFRRNKFLNSYILGSYLQAIPVYFELTNYIKAIKPDLIYIQNSREFPLVFLRACKGHETMQWVHDFGIMCPTGWCVYKDNLKLCDGKAGVKCLRHKCIPLLVFLQKIFGLKYYKKTKIIKEYITSSEILKKYMVKNGFKNVRFDRHPLNIKEGKEDVKREKNLFIYIGGLYKHKGIYPLVEAMREIVSINSDIKLEVIGFGPEEQNIKIFVAKYFLEKNIKFIGKVKYNELYKYYKRATASIVPSIGMEAWSYVVMESIYFNTPVIGSNVGGIKEQITDRNKGVLFERNNKKDLIDKILMKAT